MFFFHYELAYAAQVSQPNFHRFYILSFSVRLPFSTQRLLLTTTCCYDITLSVCHRISYPSYLTYLVSIKGSNVPLTTQNAWPSITSLPVNVKKDFTVTVQIPAFRTASPKKPMENITECSMTNTLNGKKPTRIATKWAPDCQFWTPKKP